MSACTVEVCYYITTVKYQNRFLKTHLTTRLILQVAFAFVAFCAAQKCVTPKLRVIIKHFPYQHQPDYKTNL